MARKKNTQYKNLSSESAESPSFPTTPQHQTLLDNTPTNTLLKTGIQVTPNKLSRALIKILAEKPMPINSHKQAAMTNLLERLSSLRSQQQQHTLDQPRNKRVKIEAAPDGSAALVISSSSTQPNPHSSHHHYYHRHHHNKQQLPHPTTIAPASLFSSPSSSSSLHHPILSSAEINQHSPLVSATTPEYGRVIMKKEALINKLGFQAAQRAIRRANSQRKPPYPRVDRSSNHPSSSSASSPPSSPQTWRTGTIGKWLESADEEDEDQEQHYHHFSRARDLTLSKLARESRPSGSAAHRPTDPQSLFWSPVKTRKSPSSTRRPLSHSDSLFSLSHDHHHQQLMDRLGRMDALEMGSDTTRWPINRPITPPNQRSFFHSDDWSHYQLPRPGGPQDRPDLYGPFSQLSFASHSSPGGPSFQGMLKPGCNLNQAFLVLAPSPKTQLSESNNDENRRPEIAAPPSATAKLDRPPARNDYSPCSPLRSDWRKLMEQHHFPGRLESPNPSKLRALPKPSPASPEMVDQRWLAGLDSNRLPNPPSSPPFPDDGLLNLDHFPASKSNDPLDDFLDLF